MIKTIYIKNFLLIDEQFIDFDQKLNAVFGETGSGKSILFKAFTQLSGEKTNFDLIKIGKESFFIEAVFDMNGKIEEVLVNHNLDIEDTLSLSRKVGKNSVFKINGEKISLKILKELSPLLFDFTNQHEVSKFTDNKYILDMISSNIKYDLISELYIQYQELNKKMDLLEEKQLNKNETLEILNYRLKKLENISMFNDVKEYEVYLEKYEEYKEIASNSDKLKSMLNSMNNAVKELSKVRDIYVNLEQNDVIDELDLKISEIEDYDFKLNQTYQIDFDQRDFDEMSDNINEFKTLMRTYKMSSEELLNYKSEIYNEIEQLDAIDLDLKITRKKLSEIKEKLEVESNNISSIRKDNASKLTIDIENVLKDLDMGHVRINFNFNKVSYSKNGFDDVSLEISSNNSDKFQSINNIASGGELSRILLSIKSVYNSNENSTMFFDEIDSGVSGKVAALMAKILQKLALNSQIIYISHLPQMISVANKFLYVEKTISGNDANSEIREVKDDELIDKLAYFIQNNKASKESKEVIRQMLLEVENENFSN